MSERNTVVRSLHDLGAAVWCGGALMGAVGLNGASEAVTDRTERAAVASAGWAKWTPVNIAAIAAHLVGGLGLLLANRGRVAGQSGVGANTVVKSALTAAAMGATAYSGVLGARVAKAGKVVADSGVTPSQSTPDDVAGAQQQLRILQWATPVLTAAIVVLAAQQGEQQRPDQQSAGQQGAAGLETVGELGSLDSAARLSRFPRGNPAAWVVIPVISRRLAQRRALSLDPQ